MLNAYRLNNLNRTVMAKLTEQISTVNNGKPIVDPGPADPSFLGAVAEFAAGAIPGVVGIGRERDRRTAEARQQDSQLALDELAGGVHQARLDAAAEALRPESPMPDWLGAVDNNTMLPGGVMSQANEVLRVKRAVDQGRVSAATLDMRIESLVTNLFQQHPDSRYEISVAMKGLGIDHYLFREEETRRATREHGEASSLNTERTQIEFAAARGLVTSDTPPREAARIGRIAMAADMEARAAQARAEAVRADATLSAAQREAALAEEAGNVSTALIGSAAVAVTPLIDATSLALSAAGTDAERQTVVSQFRVQTRAALVAYRGRGVAQIAAAGGNTDNIKVFTDYIDSQIEAVEGLYTTSFEQNQADSRNLAAALNIDMARALPIYNRIQQAIGPAAANAIISGLDGVPGLDPAMLEAARQEITNFDPTSARGTMNLARAIGYLRGEVGLKDLTAQEAQSYIRTNSAALLANQAAVLGGNEAALPQWRTTYANTVEAVIELAPTATSVESLARASTQFATAASRQVLATAMRDDPEYGDALAQGSRAAAAHTLLLARDVRNPADGAFTTAYNNRLGRFEAVLTRESYNTWANQQNEVLRAGRGVAGALAGGMLPGGGPGAVPSYDELRRQIPQSINQRLTAQNNSLAHLVLTDQYDEAIPRSLSGAERRRMYATGSTPESLAVRPGSDPTQVSEWERLRGNLNTQIQSLLTETISTPVPEMPARGELQNQVRDRAEAVGLPWGLVERVVRRESSWNPNAENTTTNARSLFQINDDRTDRTLEENINDGLGLLKEASEVATRVLGRAPQDWEVYVAHQQGPGGGPALLNPANANRNAVDVLAPLYPSRAIAQSAVTGNGGRANMTAAQFLQAIRAFYNG
jgi:hypothetical protein